MEQYVLKMTSIIGKKPTAFFTSALKINKK